MAPKRRAPARPKASKAKVQKKEFVVTDEQLAAIREFKRIQNEVDDNVDTVLESTRRLEIQLENEVANFILGIPSEERHFLQMSPAEYKAHIASAGSSGVLTSATGKQQLPPKRPPRAGESRAARNAPQSVQLTAEPRTTRRGRARNPADCVAETPAFTAFKQMGRMANDRPATMIVPLPGGGDAAFSEAEFAQMRAYNPRAAHFFDQLMTALREN